MKTDFELLERLNQSGLLGKESDKDTAEECKNRVNRLLDGLTEQESRRLRVLADAQAELSYKFKSILIREEGFKIP